MKQAILTLLTLLAASAMAGQMFDGTATSSVITGILGGELSETVVAHKTFVVEVVKEQWRMRVQSVQPNGGQSEPKVTYSFAGGEIYRLIEPNELMRPHVSVTNRPAITAAATIYESRVLPKETDPLVSLLWFVFCAPVSGYEFSELSDVIGVSLKQSGDYKAQNSWSRSKELGDVALLDFMNLISYGWRVDKKSELNRWPAPFEQGYTNLTIKRMFSPDEKSLYRYECVLSDVCKPQQPGGTYYIAQSVIHRLNFTFTKQLPDTSLLPVPTADKVVVADKRFQQLPGTTTNFLYTISKGNWLKKGDPRLHLMLKDQSQVDLRAAAKRRQIGVSALLGFVLISGVFILFWRKNRHRDMNFQNNPKNEN